MREVIEDIEGPTGAELTQALENLWVNDHFKVFIAELKRRRADLWYQAESDDVCRDHPRLIAAVQYTKCLGEVIVLSESGKPQ